MGNLDKNQLPVENTENEYTEDTSENVDLIEEDSGTEAQEQEVETILFDGKPLVDEAEVEEAEAEDTVVETSTFRNMRKALRAKEKAVKDAERKIRELETQLTTPPLEKEEQQKPTKPKYSDFEYDDEGYEFAMEKYATDLAQFEFDRQQKSLKENEKLKNLQTEREVLVKKYQDRGREIEANSIRTGRGKSFEDAQSIVISRLSQVQQSVILDSVDNPADLVYVLGTNPKLLEELAEIQNLARFSARLGKLSSQVHVTKVKQQTPPPEKKISSGGNPITSNSKELEKLLEAGLRTGDMTAYARALSNNKG
jgi:myosin heavy subunit